jgi:hypothetical protein
MTQHVLDEGEDGKDHWFCLCGLATDGKDRQYQGRTEGEVV